MSPTPPKPLSAMAWRFAMDKPTSRFLRNGSTDFRLRGLENKAECLGTPTQIVDHSRPVTRLVGRGAGIDIVHSVSHSIEEQNCDLAGRSGPQHGFPHSAWMPAIEGGTG